MASEPVDSTGTLAGSGVPTPTARRLAWREVGRALRHRNYRLFFAGQLVSLIGTWMQIVAQAWLMYRLTGSSVQLGLVSFCGHFPMLLLAPVGGVLADRFRRHRILLATQSASMLLAFGLAGLTLTDLVQPVHLFLFAGLLGCVNALDMPTRQAFVVQMVGRDDLMNAVALNSSIFNGARIVGPAVAGVLVAGVGEGWCFFLNGASFVAVLGGLLAMRHLPAPGAATAGSPLKSLGEGFRFVAAAAPVRAMLVLLAVVGLAGMPFTVLMPIFADRILHSGARGLGILMGAFGVGALAGALGLAARSDVRGLGRLIGASSMALGLLLVLFAASRWFWLSAALLVAVGLSMTSQMASSNTLVQMMVPDALRGRLMAVYSMTVLGTAPFGALLAGALAQTLGPTTTLVLGGSVCSVSGLVFALRVPGLRAQARALMRESPGDSTDPTGPGR
ncbi:MAG: MFS transporter [Polyangiaceae bacterium]|nr:MFS transporter [Polyangiaceae bacterium]